nr:MAG TPA: Putative conjugal transfer nickase/helicase TraI C-term [Caudoviricetes sp.]
MHIFHGSPFWLSPIAFRQYYNTLLNYACQ